MVDLVVGAREGAHRIEDMAIAARQVERLRPLVRRRGIRIKEAAETNIGVLVVATMGRFGGVDVVHKAHTETIAVIAVEHGYKGERPGNKGPLFDAPR